jgi:hypothetical protein
VIGTSPTITVNIQYDCGTDLILVNPEVPKGWTLVSSLPVMQISFEESSISTYSLSVKELFTNGYPQYCSNTGYDILKVIEKSTNK